MLVHVHQFLKHGSDLEVADVDVVVAVVIRRRQLKPRIMD